MRLKTIAPLFVIIILMVASCQEQDATSTPFPSVTAKVIPSATPVPPTLTPVPEASGRLSATVVPTEAARENLAPIVNDEGGVVNITGVVTYTNLFFTTGVASPLVILEDQAGFVDRNEEFLMPVESQTLGQITSDFFTSPFSYNLSLPIEPQGSLRDVDHDGDQDTGVQVFAVAYWNNVFGDPFLEERDLGGGGWSTAYVSTRISEKADLEREIIGGKFVVFAPDENQGFPGSFGPDGRLFTEDDPVVILPQGYTVVDMDTDPFTFDRSRDQVIDLYEPKGTALVDYSELSYTEAFDSLVEQLKKEYAFTEYKGIDWDALHATLRPRFEMADSSEDADAYRAALRDFALSIPDGHVAGPVLVDEILEAIGGGIGIAIRELDDGRVLVNFLLEGGPADTNGIQLGAEILTINGRNMNEYISSTFSHFGPYSTEHKKRLDQQLFATRFPEGTEVVIEFLNPEEISPRTTKLQAVAEFESYSFWFRNAERDGFELPVEYDLLEDGKGYVQVFSFLDNDLLTVQLWERMIRAMNENGVPALIIDMRQNAGGRGSLADNMAAYFFDEPLVLGNHGTYDEDRGEFYFNPLYEDHFFLPAEELRYHGDLAVLVGADCASACEFFSYDLTLQDRATIIGHTPTAGLGGSVERVAMPEDEEFRFTQGRAVDPDGDIHIEGIGIVPNLRVPVTESAALGQGDPVLETAISFLSGYVEGGTVALGDEISSALAADTKIRYVLALSEGDVVSIVLQGSTDMILSFYDEQGNLLGTREGRQASLEELEIPFDLTLIIEVAAVEGAGADEFTLRILDIGE